MNRGWTSFNILVCCLAFMIATADHAGAPDMPVPTRPIIEGAGKTASLNWPRNTDPLRALIVFTRFKGEAPGDSLAPAWAKTLFDGSIGSVNDYFNTVSFGTIRVIGTYLPKIYEMPYDINHYAKSEIYAQDILKMLAADPSFRFADYDNDGPDGIPNSGDDDGYVDYLVLMPRSRPYDFILKLATGVMTLPLPSDFVTQEKRPFGLPVIVDKYSGSLAVAATRAQAVTILTAEIAHVFGGVDLMDKEYVDPENDSAGAGNWDVLAWGANGWGNSGIPAGPCAYNRMLMNCVGPLNSNLVDIYGSAKGLRLREAGNPRGYIYRIMISAEEYFLIEHRSNSGSFYYDYGIPQSGILIWHINERESNSTERKKLCDLECADGKFRDFGFPKGLKPDPLNGSDNLDFWAHDAEYCSLHYGNLGDATDVFDGTTYTSFNTITNPNSFSDATGTQTGIAIFNIHREGEEMVFDCSAAFSPAVLLPRLPIVGMGYQRSKSRTPQVQTTQKAVYLAARKTTSQPELMVAVSGDSLYTLNVSEKSRLDVQRSIDSFLLAGIDLKGVQVVREPVTGVEFEQVLGETGERALKTTADSFRMVQKLSVRRASGSLPFVMEVRQNYPNPFNGETTIPYILSEPGRVRLEVFDVLGRKVAEHDEGYLGTGYHTARFSSDRLASGVYFYRIGGVTVSGTKRFVIVK